MHIVRLRYLHLVKNYGMVKSILFDHYSYSRSPLYFNFWFYIHLSIKMNRNIELSVSKNIASRREMEKVGMQYEQNVDCWRAS